jgi:GNAT superfamily N-acetyltransferase
MKITRRQLQQLISESMTQNPRQQEAAYAIIYTAGYLEASDSELGDILRNYPELGEQADKWVPLDEAFGNLNAVMIGGASAIKRKHQGLDLSEEISVLREGVTAGQADFRESIYRYIEQVATLVNRQTPMGMSAAEALGIFGIEGGGVLFRDTAIADAKHLISLMNDDNVLSWIDAVEGMKPQSLIRESGLNTTWNMGDRIVSLQDVSSFLDSQSRPAIPISACKLKKMLAREITGIEPHRVRRADISVPIIVEVDRDTGRPVVVLDGNHRLAKAIKFNANVRMRVLYSDERDVLFGELNESMGRMKEDLVSPMTRMFLQELGATFYSEYDGARTGRGVFHDKFPNNCLVRFVLFATGENTMYISDIETRGEDCQRKGYGRKVLETLVAKADMFGMTLELDAAPYSNTPLDNLYQFYTSVGFGPAAIDNHPYRMRRLPS